MSKCTKKNCPMQYNKVDENCDIKDCPWRTEQSTPSEDFFINLKKAAQTEIEKLIEKTKIETAKEIYDYIYKSGVINVAPDTIKMYFKRYGVEIDE